MNFWERENFSTYAKSRIITAYNFGDASTVDAVVIYYKYNVFENYDNKASARAVPMGWKL